MFGTPFTILYGAYSNKYELPLRLSVTGSTRSCAESSEPTSEKGGKRKNEDGGQPGGNREREGPHQHRKQGQARGGKRHGGVFPIPTVRHPVGHVSISQLKLSQPNEAVLASYCIGAIAAVKGDVSAIHSSYYGAISATPGRARP